MPYNAHNFMRKGTDEWGLQPDKGDSTPVVPPPEQRAVILEHPCSDDQYVGAGNDHGINPDILSWGFYDFLLDRIPEITDPRFGVCLIRPIGTGPYFSYDRFSGWDSTNYRFDHYELVTAGAQYPTLPDDLLNAVHKLGLAGRLLLDFGAPHKERDPPGSPPLDLTYTNLAPWMAGLGAEFVADASTQMPYDWTTGQNVLSAMLAPPYSINWYTEGAGLYGKWYSSTPAFANYYNFKDGGVAGAANNRAIDDCPSGTIVWVTKNAAGGALTDAEKYELAAAQRALGRRVALRKGGLTTAQLESLL